MASGDENQARWWEFYAVRYGTGAVVGAFVIFYIIYTNRFASELFFGKGGERLDGTQIAILLGLGLAYSYIASAPILVFHACRFLYEPASGGSINRKKGIYYILASSVLPSIFVYASPLDGIALFWFVLVLTLMSMLIVAQFMSVWQAFTKVDQLFKFYLKLSKKRESAKGGLLDSYRHLREHGNSFLIVFLEIILGLMLIAVTSYSQLVYGESNPVEFTRTIVVAIMVWLTPAAAVWGVGIFLEREFIDS